MSRMELLLPEGHQTPLSGGTSIRDGERWTRTHQNELRRNNKGAECQNGNGSQRFPGKGNGKTFDIWKLAHTWPRRKQHTDQHISTNTPHRTSVEDKQVSYQSFIFHCARRNEKTIIARSHSPASAAMSHAELPPPRTNTRLP